MTDQEKIIAIKKELNAVKKYDRLDEAVVTLNRIGAILNEGKRRKNEPYKNRMLREIRQNEPYKNRMLREIRARRWQSQFVIL
jgi:hypothetical protein